MDRALTDQRMEKYARDGVLTDQRMETNHASDFSRCRLAAKPSGI
jgi:hypothetical protein